jgi:hypothetical protein
MLQAHFLRRAKFLIFAPPSEGYVVGMIGRRGKGIGDDYKGKDGVLADAVQVVHRG